MENQALNTSTMDSNTISPIPMRHILGYSLGMFGMNVSLFMVSAYLPYFYTDVFLLSPAIMTVLFLSCRLWDAANDPIMAVITDSTSSRWGRFRPYLLFPPVLFIVFLGLTFYVPDFNTTGKIIWAFVTYFGLQMVKTIVAIPYMALSAVITNDTKTRAKISGIQSAFANICLMMVSALTMPLVHKFATEREGFTYTALIFGVFAVIFMWIPFLSTRQYDTPERLKLLEAAADKKLAVKDRLRIIFQNKPLMMLIAPIFCQFTAMALAMGAPVYYFKYNLKNPDGLPPFMGTLIVFTILGSIAAPFVMKKLGKLRTYHVSNILSFLCLFLVFFLANGKSPESLATLMAMGGPLSSLTFFAYGLTSFTSVALIVMVLDCIEYSEWKTGERMEGLINAVYLIGAKGGLALGGVIIGFIFWVVDYQPNQNPSSDVLLGIAAMLLLIPAIVKVFMSLVMLFYDLTETKHQQIVAEIAQRQLQT